VGKINIFDVKNSNYFNHKCIVFGVKVPIDLLKFKNLPGPVILVLRVKSTKSSFISDIENNWLLLLKVDRNHT